MNRKFPSSIKSLLHFDFPYFAENNDGLRDEVSRETWQRNGDVKFVGLKDEPYELAIDNCPKFGYRCPSFNVNSFLSCTNDTGIFSLRESGEYELEFFMRLFNPVAGKIYALKSGENYTLTFSHTGNGGLSINGATAENPISLYDWHHCLTRMTGKKIFVFIDGSQIIQSDFAGAECTSFELGGCIIQIDEFILRHEARKNFEIPQEPYQGKLQLQELGGFGDSRHGDQSITSNSVINSYGYISDVKSNSSFTVSNWYNGKYGALTVGDEVMIHLSLPHESMTLQNDTGRYAFRKIASISGNMITLDRPITEFNFAGLCPTYYKAQVISVPNFASLKISDGTTISPKNYENNCGGLIAFRVAGNFINYGQIISHGYGPVRIDNLQLTHAGLIDNFILNKGGGIFIAAKNFSAVSSARIGATWDGSLKSSEPERGAAGINGGAGYGGSGGGGYGQGGGGTGAAGGVGGGGGGGGIYPNPKISKYHSTGGNSRYASGGTQGITIGAQGEDNGNGSGGGGAGGNSGTTSDNLTAYAGANVIILAEKFSCPDSVISTGGQGGTNTQVSGSGGGGAGFCYIACKELG